MDTSLFRHVNRFADHTSWLHPFAVAYAKDGIVVFAALMVLAFWRARQGQDLAGEAGAAWAGAAALVALGLGQLIGGAIDRDRPYENLAHVHVLVSRTTDFSIPSDHATAVGAVAIALLFVDRKIGIVAAVLAVLMAATRVYVGAHYPTDVLAGLALGGLVALVGARPATRLLTTILARAAALPGLSAVIGRPSTA